MSIQDTRERKYQKPSDRRCLSPSHRANDRFARTPVFIIFLVCAPRMESFHFLSKKRGYSFYKIDSVFFSQYARYNIFLLWRREGAQVGVLAYESCASSRRCGSSECILLLTCIRFLPETACLPKRCHITNIGKGRWT